jgi:hypothetical protein
VVTVLSREVIGAVVVEVILLGGVVLKSSLFSIIDVHFVLFVEVVWVLF